MTVVEFFDRSPIENMISAFAHEPERVVLVGQSKLMKKQDHVFRRFLDAAGNHVTQLEYRGVMIHELHEIVGVLTQIVEDYPECIFDLTGGDDLTMVAIGIVFERYREKGLELHQYNIRTGKIYDCDLDGNVLDGAIPDMSVEQNIILHGGSIVSSDQRENGTYDWHWDEAFIEDVNRMWEVCRQYPPKWNYQINLLDQLEACDLPGDDPLELAFTLEAGSSYLADLENAFRSGGVLHQLYKIGLITDYDLDDSLYRVCFKNEQIRRCLTKAGTVLELKTLLIAKSVVNADGTPRYHDLMTGVFIDWDGIVHSRKDHEVDTENEIDLILMHGLVPVFISCKNGEVTTDELYKLNTVANRFGGKYAKKILAAASCPNMYIRQRAKDMGIYVLQPMKSMDDEMIRKSLRSMD